eukprot:12825421-Alexandrium_andersonii.AAC.1
MKDKRAPAPCRQHLCARPRCANRRERVSHDVRSATLKTTNAAGVPVQRAYEGTSANSNATECSCIP